MDNNYDKSNNNFINNNIKLNITCNNIYYLFAVNKAMLCVIEYVKFY